MKLIEDNYRGQFSELEEEEDIKKAIEKFYQGNLTSIKRILPLKENLHQIESDDNEDISPIIKGQMEELIQGFETLQNQERSKAINQGNLEEQKEEQNQNQKDEIQEEYCRNLSKIDSLTVTTRGLQNKEFDQTLIEKQNKKEMNKSILNLLKEKIKNESNIFKLSSQKRKRFIKNLVQRIHKYNLSMQTTEFEENDGDQLEAKNFKKFVKVQRKLPLKFQVIGEIVEEEEEKRPKEDER